MTDPQQHPAGEGTGDGGRVEVDHAARTTTVVLHGEVDAALAGRLEELRAQAVATGYPVTLDVTAVPFMDSSGASFLVRLTQGVAPHRVALVGPSPQVLTLLELTRLATLVDITPR